MPDVAELFPDAELCRLLREQADSLEGDGMVTTARLMREAARRIEAYGEGRQAKLN